MEIFKLIGSIMVDTAEANKSISKTEKQAESLGSKLTSGVKTAGKWAAGVAGAAVAVGGAMVAAAKGVAADLDAIDKGSQRMGITAEQYQELAYAAGMCGVEMSTMEKAAKKLEGTNLDMDEAMNQLMSIGDETVRTQAAIDLFGESIAYEMAPLLKIGADEFSGLKDEAHDLGIIMSNETVAAGAAMGDAFSRVEQSLKAAGETIMVSFFPYIQEVLDWITENLPMLQETVQNVLDAIMPAVQTVMETIMELLPPLLEAIKAAIDFVMPYVQPVVDAVAAAIKAVLDLINGDIDGFVEGMKTFFTGMISVMTDLGSNIFGGLWDGLKSMWANIDGWLSGVIDSIANWFSGLGTTLQNILTLFTPVIDGIKAAVDSVMPYVQPVIDAVSSAVEAVLDLINGDIDGFVDGMKTFFSGLVSVMSGLGGDIFGGLWDGLKNMWSSIDNWISGVVNSITDWFSGIGSRIASFFGFGGDDGSHAAGLPTVPYDNYKANLHKGETVLNANDTSKLLEAINNGGSGESGPVNITVQNVLDGKVIGEFTYNYNRRREMAVGI